MQANRLLAVGTVLGPDELLLQRMSAAEELGRLFRYDLVLLSKNHELNLADLLGTNMTVRYELPGGETRYFNGVVSSFALADTSYREFSVYHATLRPWTWLLTRTADCRIFQDQTIPDIVKQVCRDHGFTDFEDQLSGSYEAKTYCVQYRETDFNFISRLMEQEGIYYFFKHEDGKHQMVLSDSYSSHAAFPGYEDIPYFPQSEDAGVRREEDHVWSWELAQEIQPGAYALTDFDYEKPKSDLLAKEPFPRQHAHSEFEVFDYPGEYLTSGEGGAYAKVRIQELQSQYEVARGTGNASGVATGHLADLSRHPRDDQNREYLFISASYELQNNEFESGEEEGVTYQVTFEAIDSKQPFRPARSTPKPVVQGPQTAIVVGKKGEEIWTDKHGRVKVQFHWDRYGKADESSSCWVRVVHSWAGKGWGALHVPRLGHEVVVEFLEGDPDRPLVTGSVYNGDNKAPWELPDEATRSGIKTNTSKGGSGFNELRFEDKKGEEQVFLHGERNLDIRVKNSTFEFVGNERHLKIKKNQIEHVEENLSEKIDKDQVTEIGGQLTVTVGGDVAEKFDGDHSEVTAGDVFVKGTNLVLEGTSSVTIKVGGSHLAMDATGITIKTTQLAMEGSATAEMKSATVKINGSAMTEIKGGIVKIN